MKKKLLWFIPCILIIVVYIAFFSGNYSATELAMQSADTAIPMENHLFFDHPYSDIGIIIYPGGKVDYEAYAPLANLLAEEYNVFVVQMPLNLAIFGSNRAASIINDHSSIKTWYIGGHSLGGVMASQYAHAHQEQITGLFLLASYPQEKHNFSDSNLQMLSIDGSRDGLIDYDTLKKATEWLPEHTVYHTIEGGNHAQMGSYGKQKNDLDATITPEEQLQMVSAFIISWITSHSNN